MTYFDIISKPKSTLIYPISRWCRQVHDDLARKLARAQRFFCQMSYTCGEGLARFGRFDTVAIKNTANGADYGEEDCHSPGGRFYFERERHGKWRVWVARGESEDNKIFSHSDGFFGELNFQLS